MGPLKKKHSLICVRMRFSQIFGRTDLRVGVSEAKFDARLDFEVYLLTAPQKPHQKCEHLFFLIKCLPTKFFSTSKNEMLRKENCKFNVKQIPLGSSGKVVHLEVLGWKGDPIGQAQV